jgi:molecular chaperone HtpG
VNESNLKEATPVTATAETLEFKTELKQLLHIITHSLYSHKEIFLRELISNASDAINKVKFDSLNRDDMLEGNKDWKIEIAVDKDKKTLTISDNGIGMSRAEAVENLGTIAKSGTRAFLDRLQNSDTRERPELIGQFGVGFYSAFMVADRVTVVSRRAGEPKDGVRWKSDGQGEFHVEAVEKPERGTDVILHLKEDEKEFLDPYALRQLVKRFSDFIEHAVVMEVEKDEDGKKTTVEETLNARKAIWLRSPSEVTPDEYKEFYRQISGNFDDPAHIIHYVAEGTNEFRVLLFVPSKKPFELQWSGDYKGGPRLYVQRVLIMEHCDKLLPPYLRFVRGVVDSTSLPLNISRELLQQNPVLERMAKNVVKNVLDALKDMKESEYDKYVSFFKELGSILKEGVGRDWNNREKLADLLLFESINTPAGQYTTLAQYVEKMPADQKEIIYLTGEERRALEHSPYVEAFRAKGQDVLLLTDPIDEFILPGLPEYKGKHLQAADRGELADKKEENKEETAKYEKLFAHLKAKIDEVSEVRLSSRLKESASCLVAADGTMSAHMERLMEKLGRAEDGGRPKRVLELNGTHPAVVALRELYDKNPDDPRVESHGRLLYEQAVLAEGSKLQDPASFARRINELLVKDAQLSSKQA